MKKIILFLAFLAVASFAQKNNAIGVWFGDGGVGFDYKRLMGKGNALDIYVGDFELGDNSAIGVGAGYYFLFDIVKADASIGRFPLHVGPNLGFGLWSGKGYGGFDIGLKAAGGISWFTPTTPVMDVSIELVSPNLVSLWHNSYELANGDEESDTSFKLVSGSLGFRILFHVYFF